MEKVIEYLKKRQLSLKAKIASEKKRLGNFYNLAELMKRQDELYELLKTTKSPTDCFIYENELQRIAKELEYRVNDQEKRLVELAIETYQSEIDQIEEGLLILRINSKP